MTLPTWQCPPDEGLLVPPEVDVVEAKVAAKQPQEVGHAQALLAHDDGEGGGEVVVSSNRLRLAWLAPTELKLAPLGDFTFPRAPLSPVLGGRKARKSHRTRARLGFTFIV